MVLKAEHHYHSEQVGKDKAVDVLWESRRREIKVKSEHGEQAILTGAGN